MNVQQVGERVILLVEEVLVKSRAADNFAAAEGQEFHQGIFTRRERDRMAGTGHAVPGGVDDQRADLHHIPRLPGGAADQRTQPGQQLIEVERLHHIIVGPAVQAAHAIAGGVAGGQHQHGRLLGLAQTAEDGPTVEAREHHVRARSRRSPNSRLSRALPRRPRRHPRRSPSRATP